MAFASLLPRIVPPPPPVYMDGHSVGNDSSVGNELLNRPFVYGSCQQMCPQSEIEMREREDLIHILETDPSFHQERRYGVKLICDRARAVKSYLRSAAGMNMQNPDLLRPPHILRQTVFYLLTKVIYDARVTWSQRYHFIADRLRAVKQDLIIQQPSVSQSISILEPMVRFYFVAAYWGRRVEDPTGQKQEIQRRSEFCPVQNQKQLEECLKYLLSLYDEVGDFFAFPARPQMEALYQLQYLGETEALRRGVALPQNPSQDLRFALKMSLEWYNKKYSSVIKYSKHLTVFLRMAFSFNLPKIRRHALEVMNTAYSNKNPNLNFHYSLDLFTKILNFRNLSEASRLCENHGVRVCKNKVMFLRGNFTDECLQDFELDFTGPDYVDEYVDEALKHYKLCNLLINYLDDAYTTDLCRGVDALSIC